ncbi:hypothetical protein AB5J49_15455 [Streptomyces sp. R28]|uniref:Uncharacterized protein n=1 Tax=Streptomyces sp. R28 TaxID=3238628 RepID=A0AB39PXU6_9ACTN
MILREFLYVDTDKVRAMLAQLEGGVAEEERETDREEKRTTVGPRTVAQHFQGVGSERYTQKSLGDALFPMLEDALESESLLRDISEEVTNTDLWNTEEIQRMAPPGSLVRITAPGSLFDSRYVANSFSAFAAVSMGLQGIGALESPPPRQNSGKNPKGQQRKPKPGEVTREELEDSIPDFRMKSGETIVDAVDLRSILQVSRGVFAPGLHMNLSPVESSDILITSRLQEGRQYLDSESDILFARYGTEEQEWTVVGSVGHYGSKDPVQPDDAFFNSNGAVSRGKLASFMNAHMRTLAETGFVDLVQYPGVSLIPFAVYRSIPRAAGVIAAR